ncbi:MAG: nuclear transport factor 2 family protein [Pyrinomonadaceae bacterium]
MKNLVIVAVMMMLGISVAKGQTQGVNASQDAKAEQELRKLEREWLDAYDNHDVEAMKRIVADDFTITYENGSVLDKAKTVGMLRPGTPKNPDTSQWTEDSKVRLYGDTAIITGKYVFKRRDKDKEIVSESRYTDTYIKRNGRWQVVASHLSNIAKK